MVESKKEKSIRNRVTIRSIILSQFSCLKHGYWNDLNQLGALTYYMITYFFLIYLLIFVFAAGFYI